MSYDPQNAPSHYVSQVGPAVTDTEGIDWIQLEDQDGDRTWITADEWKHSRRSW